MFKRSHWGMRSNQIVKTGNKMTNTSIPHSADRFDGDIKNHDYKGFAIAQRNDGYVNITKLAQSEGKRLNDYSRLKTTVDFIEALSVSTGISALTLVQFDSSTSNDRATWAHPIVAMDVAQWVSVDCRIWANTTLVRIVANRGEIAPVSEKIRLAELRIELHCLIVQFFNSISGKLSIQSCTS
jgi:hypothetical protein